MLTSAEARKRIGVNRNLLAKLIRDGELEAIKTGDAPNSHYRITEESVEAFLARRKAQLVKAAS
jgi:excisionase family DNA binding protein